MTLAEKARTLIEAVDKAKAASSNLNANNDFLVTVCNDVSDIAKAYLQAIDLIQRICPAFYGPDIRAARKWLEQQEKENK